MTFAHIKNSICWPYFVCSHVVYLRLLLTNHVHAPRRLTMRERKMRHNQKCKGGTCRTKQAWKVNQHVYFILIFNAHAYILCTRQTSLLCLKIYKYLLLVTQELPNFFIQHNGLYWKKSDGWSCFGLLARSRSHSLWLWKLAFLKPAQPFASRHRVNCFVDRLVCVSTLWSLLIAVSADAATWEIYTCNTLISNLQYSTLFLFSHFPVLHIPRLHFGTVFPVPILLSRILSVPHASHCV